MNKEEILNGKTRAQLAAMIGIAYMNETGASKERGKAVMRGWLKGAGAAKPAKKEEMIKAVLHFEEQGFIKIA